MINATQSDALRKSMDMIDAVFSDRPFPHTLEVTRESKIYFYNRTLVLSPGSYSISIEPGLKNVTKLDGYGNVIEVSRLASLSVMGSGNGIRHYNNGFVQTRDNYPNNGDHARMASIIQKHRKV